MNSLLPPPLPRRRSRIVRWLLIGAGFLVLAVIVLVVCFAVWRSRLRKEVNARVAAIRAAGLPTNWEEQNQWYPDVPTNENAAFIYTNAFAHIDSNSIPPSLPEFLMPRRGLPLTNELRTLAPAALQANRAALELAYQAAALPKSRYPVDFRAGADTLLPHLGRLKALARLLDFEAFFKAEAGDAAGAARAVEASLATARSLDNEPALISQLVAISLRTLACQSLERVLCRTPLSDAQLSNLVRSLAEADATNHIITGLIGDRAQGMEYIRLAQDDVRRLIEISNQNKLEEEKASVPPVNPGPTWKLIGLFERDRAFYLRAMETNLLIAATPPPACLDMTNQTEQIWAECEKGHYLISGLFLPAGSRAVAKDVTCCATLRTAQTALAIERWRAAHAGALPDSLDVLVPAFLPSVPRDPFDGQPLRFKRLPRGYVVYSIGPDRRDDGGLEKPPYHPKMKLEDREKFDILFTVDR